jgi:hypothetical protein
LRPYTCRFRRMCATHKMPGLGRPGLKKGNPLTLAGPGPGLEPYFNYKCWLTKC